MRISSPRPNQTEIDAQLKNATVARRRVSGVGRCMYLAGIALIAFLGVLLKAPAAEAQANVTGQWQTLSTQMPINPVHVALMYNGKILVVSGSGNYPPNTNYAAAVWDPSTNTVTTQPVGWDMFCNGMLVLPDGRPFVVGGTLQYDPFFGWKRTSGYDPATGNFVDMQDMAHGRWYPTTTELGDGRFMTFSGLDENGNTNTQVEIYKLGVGWGSPATASWTPDLYPRLHLLPNGTVFYSGATTQSRTFNPSTMTWSGVVATTNYGGTRTYGTSVLFPLTPANGYKPEIVIFGGDSPSTATSEFIDLSVAKPAWTYGPPMSQPRIEMNGTMLPNGKILLVGGSLNDEDTTTASLNADLYDTSTNTMSSAGANAFPRLYHSVSLLLPDGTVWLAGGNPTRGSYVPQVEIYSPAYLFNADGSLATRPTITAVTPSVIGYGTSFQVQTPDAANITSVVLMKDGATTHAFNMDQRLVGLSYTTGSSVLNVTGPPNGNIAPPGYYMLFLINSSGVPSIAKFVQVSTAPTDIPPTGTITSPASNVFIAPGQSVTYAGTGTAPSGSIASYSWVFRGGSPATSALANPGAVTYATAGTYSASLIVTDSAGITDPSPKTRTITVTSTPAPILTAVSPTSGTQSQSNLSIVLTGSKFVSGATCNFGAGININSCTFNSATQITANINIIGSAPAGGHNVIVTNPDGQSSTLANGFTVQQGIPNPPPTITAANPNSGMQGQTSVTVTITGTNFLPGPACDFDSDEGLTTNSCTYNSPTQITANLTIALNAVTGGHNIVVTDTDGQSATLVNGFTVNTLTGNAINLGSGFTAGSVVLNGFAVLNGKNLEVTDGGSTEAGSAWYTSPINIQAFTTNFSIQSTAGTDTADGMTFTIQGNTTAALGPEGGGLGYGPDAPTNPSSSAHTPIGKSVAVKFDLYDNNGEGPDSTGLYTDGASPTTPAVDMTSSGVNLHSGDVFNVLMTYDGTNLVMTITDTTTNAKFTQTSPINIPGIVGGNLAYVGFTGGTGGLTSAQNVLSWTMSSTAPGGTSTPAFSLAGGTYLGTQTVSLSDLTSGATIFYTLDGTTPATTAGGSTFQYTGAITVSATETINAIATAPGLATSPMNSASYVIESQVATPVFLPLPGTFTTVQSVALSTTTPGASIYYTTNNTTPTTSSTLYTAAIPVNATETIQVIAAETGFFNSTVASGTFTINLPVVATPVITPATGTYTSAQPVTITDTTGGAAIYYTTNGSTPTTSSTLYNGSFVVSTTTTVKAIAVESGFANSSVATSVITLNIPTTATPVITPATGTYTTPETVNITDTTTGAAIYYTTDGTTPTTSSAKFSGSFVINATTTVKAIAGASGFNNSAVASSVITINLPTAAKPVITPATGTFTSPQTATITDTSTGATIYYTLDGSTPTTSSAVYNTAILVGATTTIKAIAGGTAYKTSAVTTSTITINLPTAATPVITPATGTYTAAQTATITDTSSGAIIYYTTDGTTPTTSSAVYSTGIPVNATTTVKALAGGPAFKTSAVATSVIIITLPAATPVITPATGTYTTTQSATITDASSGATIYYTIDGSTPTTSSKVYSTAIPVGATTTVKAIASGGGFSSSTVATSVITINLPIATVPVIAPATGTYTTPQSATISDVTPGAVIYYTLDGTTPTTNSAVYNTAIPLSSTTTVNAIAAASGFANSGVSTSVITINLPVTATPVISPVGGPYLTAQTVTITDATPGATIYYTTNGSTPTTRSTQYTSPIVVSTSQTINAMAAASGDTNSSVATAAYSIGVATPTLVQFTAGSSTQNNATGSYIISLPNPSLPGNLLACGFARASGTVTTTVSDDKNQTWTAGPTSTDSVNGELSAIYYFPNTAAGVRQVTIHFSTNKTYIAAACWEFDNVALSSPVDGSAGHSDLGSPTNTVTSGSLTPTTSGDLILMWAFRTGGANTVWTQGTSPWKLTSADAQDGMASQYQIQATAAAINPTMTTDGAVDWTAVGVAFKSAAAGTAPGAGMRVISVLHHAINNTALSYKNGVPTNGNMQVVAYVGQAGLDLCPMTGGTGSCAGKAGVVDSHSNTWVSSGTILAAAGDSQQYYTCNATAGTPTTVTFNFNGANNGSNVWFYDIAGAPTTCFDKQTVATGTQSGSAGDFAGASLAPITANGVLIGTVDVANDYLSATATASCYFDSTVTIPNISADPADQNNGAMHCYPPNTSSVTTHWTSSGGPVGAWGNYLVSYKPQ